MLKKIIVILLVILLLPANQILADSQDSVTVVAQPYVGMGITGFTVTVVSDTHVDLDWTYGPEITNVLIRAKYGDYPIDRNDGYFVYEGSGTDTEDTSMDFDQAFTPLYYRIWAEDDGYWFDSEVNTGEAEGVSMYLFALIFLSLALTIGGYTLHRGSLAFAGMAAWITTAAFCFIEADGTEAVYWAIAWVSIAMMITSGIEGALLSRSGEKIEDDIEYENELQRNSLVLEDRNKQLRARRGR